MPVTIKKSQLLYKDTSTGNYVSVDAVADKTSEQQINGIQVAANNAISAINDALDDISTEPLTELPKKAYKNDLTTNTESLGSSASKAYSVGDYFYVSDNENDRSLYKVTADIASGDTISAGTAASNNCIPAALAEDVNALSNDLDNKSYKNDLTTNVESLGSASSKAYSIGDYFYVADNENNRSLYKVTAYIASGTTLSPGTASSNNCKPVALTDELGEVVEEVSSIKGNLNTNTEKLDDIYTDIYGEYTPNIKWHRGSFEANGYSALGNLRYVHTDILEPGNYTVAPKTGYYSEVYLYVSDTEGTKLYGMSGNQLSFTTSTPVVVTSRKNPIADISDTELESYGNGVDISVKISDSNIKNDILESKNEILGLKNVDAKFSKTDILIDGLIYFYYRQRPTITKNSDRSITVEVPENPRGVYVKNGNILPISATITPESYTVPTGSYFVYNITSSTFEIVTYQQINASTNELIMLFNNQNGYLYGQWTHYLLEDAITELDLETKSYIDELTGLAKLPSYYESYLEQKLVTIRKRISEAGNSGVSFAFISDIHYDNDKLNNARNSPILLREINKRTPINLMICGGDLITYANGSKDAGLELEQEVINDFRSKSNMLTLWAVGNHEFNNPGNDPSLIDQQLSLAEIYPTIIQNNFYIEKSDTSGAYYFDDKRDKVRFLFAACTFDSQIEDASITWLMEKLPDTPADYDIVLISHLGIYYNSSSSTYTGPVNAFKPILQALQAYKNHQSFSYNEKTYDFTAKTGTVLGAFLGHYHIDGKGTWYDIPCFIITTDSLNQKAGSLTREIGTITEQAFDIVTIDRSEKTIYCTRIGAGEDRDLSYN